MLNPFRLVLDVSVRLSTDYSLQHLRRAVEPVRSTSGWERRSPDSLAAFYLRNTSSLHKAILMETDSLFLSNTQVAALKHADDAFSDSVRTIYKGLGQFLAKGQGDAGKMEIDSVLTAQKAYWKIFWEQPEIADSIMTSSQKELFPMMKSIVSVPKRDREHSQWQFGNPVTFVDTGKRAAEAPSTNKSGPPP